MQPASEPDQQKRRRTALIEAVIAFALMAPIVLMPARHRYQPFGVGDVALVVFLALGFGLSLSAVRFGSLGTRVCATIALLLYTGAIGLVSIHAVNQIRFILEAGVPLYFDPDSPGGG